MPSPDETLFASALALPPAERAAFLLHACNGDALQVRRLTDLLAAHEQADAFMAAPAAKRAAAPAPEEATGTRIGRYKILEKIGEGGCGTVYMAEQAEPVRRRVALKVIKLGMDTKEVIARFDAERQALALMDHPNIARVLDAGATETGRPFFVMELVRGVKLTEYCDANALAIPARLQLFMQVCSAVQHAHQKGIVHRDLKPSNILVTLHDGVPVPKVIDFGIAKATQGKLTDHTLFTAFEQFVGTPAYMSPEQAELSGLDIDTRSDVYSLGVLLYELLTGMPPFDPKTLVAAGLDEIRRVIREVEPPRPSTRLSTLGDGDRTAIAKQRGLLASHLSQLLRGDLDWIIMRCLEKDRTRRYDTATSLADDIRRHLENEPVVARPPSAGYRLQKLSRRHRVAFTVGAIVATILVLATVVSQWQALRATRAEKLAETRLQAELAARQEAEEQRQLAVRGLAAEQAARQETEQQKALAEQERNRAQGAEKLAAERAQAEAAARREAEQQKFLAERERMEAEQQKTLAEQERNRALAAEKATAIEAARNAEAARLMQNMLKGAGPHVALVTDLKLLHRMLDRTAQRLPFEPEGPAKAELRNALGAVYYDLGKYTTSTAIGGKWDEKDHPPLAQALNRLGTVLMRRGSLSEAEVMVREAVAVDRLVSVAGNGNPASLILLSDLSRLLKLTGQLAEAAQLDAEVQSRREKAN